MNLSEHLLSHRESISLQGARVYLGSRVRVRTPLGASEFLLVHSQSKQSPDLPVKAQAGYDWRVKTALDCDEIYRTIFPREYAGSPSPYLSIQREQEMYMLVHRCLFPVLHNYDEGRPTHPTEAKRFFEAFPDYAVPIIELRGQQRHHWDPELTDFGRVNLAYQVALALSREWDYMPGADMWSELSELRGLNLPEPSLPLASVGWTEFLHVCAVEVTPLRFLPLVFQAISYKTGNPFLDLPPIGAAMGFAWELRKVLQLSLMWANAIEMMTAIDSLARWLEEDPARRVARAYELWNHAAAIEAESPFAGMLPSDLIAAGALPVSGDMEWVMLTRQMFGEAEVTA